MTLPGNGKTKQYLAILYMVAATAFIAVDKLASKDSQTSEVVRQVSVNTNRITSIEARLISIEKTGDQTLAQVEKNREANFNQYKEIMAEIRGVKK